MPDFHIMRDHPLHGTTILGGEWGSKLTNDDVRTKWKKTWEDGLKDQIVWASRSSHGSDQVFLNRFCILLLSIKMIRMIKMIKLVKMIKKKFNVLHVLNTKTMKNNHTKALYNHNKLYKIFRIISSFT